MRKQNITTEIKNFKGYYSIDDISRLNSNTGHHFFDKDSMRYFNGRVLDTVYSKKFFITSEKYENKPRCYTVRMICKSGAINTVSEFNVLTKYGAEKFVRAYCSEELAIMYELLVLLFNTGKHLRGVTSFINKNKDVYETLKNETDISDFLISGYESAVQNG